MIDVSWLDKAMEEAGFQYNKDLAEAADVSGSTVGNALKKGRVRESTARKLQKACDPHPIGPFADTNRAIAHDREYSVAIPPEQDPEDCLRRFEGADCPTTSATCCGCFDKLSEILDPSDLPFNRAVCRLQHSWRQRKGRLVYIAADGSEKTAEELVELNSS